MNSRCDRRGDPVLLFWKMVLHFRKMVLHFFFKIKMVLHFFDRYFPLRPLFSVTSVIFHHVRHFPLRPLENLLRACIQLKTTENARERDLAIRTFPLHFRYIRYISVTPVIFPLHPLYFRYAHYIARYNSVTPVTFPLHFRYACYIFHISITPVTFQI